MALLLGTEVVRAGPRDRAGEVGPRIRARLLEQRNGLSGAVVPEESVQVTVERGVVVGIRLRREPRGHGVDPPYLRPGPDLLEIGELRAHTDDGDAVLLGRDHVGRDLDVRRGLQLLGERSGGRAHSTSRNDTATVAAEGSATSHSLLGASLSST